MSKIISLNKILKIINILILIISWITYNNLGPNIYINFWSLVLNSVLILETIIFLSYSQKYKNPLLFISSFILTFFYNFRILTLTFNPFSIVFLRFNCTWIDTNYALSFIIISSFALFLGIHLGRKKSLIHTQTSVDYPDIFLKPNNAIIILVLSLFLMFTGNLEGSILSIISGYISSLFLNVIYLLLACFVFFLFYRENLTKGKTRAFYILIIIFIIGQVFSGSRSALLSIATIIMFGILSYQGIIFLKLKHIVAILVLIPIALIFFLFSTYIRQNSARDFSFNQKTELIKTFIELDDVNNEKVFKVILAPIFDRIGFFDYATEMIAQKPIYASVLNFQYYFKSIVDNVLTPGFDIYDTPKASNALIFIYGNRGIPSLHEISKDNYQSDEMTVYGEFYNLWGGWFSVIIFFYMGFLFQKFMSKTCKNEFIFFLKNAFIINAFYILYNSFGLDWFLFNLISFFTTYYIFIFSLRIKKIKISKQYFFE
jgi:hypothetical protein